MKATTEDTANAKTTEAPKEKYSVSRYIIQKLTGIKGVRICRKNCQKIRSLLKQCNGRSEVHCYTTYSEIVEVCDDANSILRSAGVGKSERDGTVYLCESGHVLPGAYRYRANTTSIGIKYKDDAWYLMGIRQSCRGRRDIPKRAMIVLKQGVKNHRLRIASVGNDRRPYIVPDIYPFAE